MTSYFGIIGLVLLLSSLQHVLGAVDKTESAVPLSDDLLRQLQQQLHHEIHPLWLRERCREAFYADPETRQPKYNLHEEVPELMVINVDYTHHQNDEDDGFVVTFSDQQRCFFSTATLQAELANDETFLQSLEFQAVPRRLWNQSSLVAPSVFDHDEIVNTTTNNNTTTTSYDVRKTKQFLSVLLSTGVAVVENVRVVPGECARFGQTFSSVRETEWGRNFNVRSTPDTQSGAQERKDLAYSSHSIGMHVDSPYRVDTPPAFQLLHALEHCHPSEEGCQVHNRLVDGFAVAQALCEQRREHFDMLTTTILRWENNGGDDSSLLYRYAPMIELEDRPPSFSTNHDDKACPPIRRINFSAKSGGYAPHLADYDQQELFYYAKRCFSKWLHSDEYAIQVQLYPGALLIFDNRRVLHSRSAIQPSDGPRWLQGCYLDRDGIGDAE